MGDIYITDMVDIISDAGVSIGLSDVNEGWEYRSRSSGGFPEMPLGCVWHHTASSATPASDLNYMIHVSDNAPVGNLLLDRDGVVWPIAGGAANTQGKGGPWYFSRGVCPIDEGNSRLFGLEVANNGVGEVWPVDQIDAYFIVSNVLNAHFGNRPDDVVTHYMYAPDRKIDPAKATSVQGPWVPRANNSSGTWDLFNIQNECIRRWAPPNPVPTPTGDTDMIRLDYGYPGIDDWWTRMVLAGCEITWVQGHANDQLDETIPGHIQVRNDEHMIDLLKTFRAIGSVPSTFLNNQPLVEAWVASGAK